MWPAAVLRRMAGRRAAWPWVCAAFMVGLLGPGPAAVAGVPTQTLPVAMDRLSDDDFFSPALDPDLSVQLLDSGFVGVALRAPSRVDVDRRSTLPVLVASRFDGARDWTLPLHEGGWLVAIDLHSGLVSLASAFGATKRAAPASRRETPSVDALRGIGAQLTRVDARSRLGIPWQYGCWSISLLYHDWVSNPIVVRLMGPQMNPAHLPGGDICRTPEPAAVEVAFRRQASPGAAVRVAGRFTGPADSAVLFIVTPDGAVPARHDWPIRAVIRPEARQVWTEIDHILPAVGPPPPGTVAYLVLAGQVHGPYPWTETLEPVRR